MSNNTQIIVEHGTLLSIKRWLYPLLTRPRVAHAIKYIVYVSLVINFFLYFIDDYNAFRAALPPDAPIADIAEQFSTTIDMFAWLGLVFLFELETYAIPDEKFTNWLTVTIRGLRFACYVGIAYAAYGYTAETLETYDYAAVDGVSNVCELAGDGASLQINVIDYVEIAAENCEQLSNDEVFYRFANEVSYIGQSLIPHVQFMGWIDVLNAVVWIIVVLLIEVEIWLQSADRFWSPALTIARQAKTIFYLILIGNGVIWALDLYFLYTWDAFLWIFGFWAIELNLAEWEIDRVKELQYA